MRATCFWPIRYRVSRARSPCNYNANAVNIFVIILSFFLPVYAPKCRWFSPYVSIRYDAHDLFWANAAPKAEETLNGGAGAGITVRYIKCECDCMVGQSQFCFIPNGAKSHLDLGRAPYVLYGVKYIDLVSLW